MLLCSIYILPFLATVKKGGWRRQTWSLLHLTQEQLEGAFFLLCELQDCMLCEGTGVYKMTIIVL